MNLRCGARVIAVLARFPARSFEELFQGTKSVAWEEYLPLDAAFPVKGYSINSQLHAVPACQSIIKKAVVDRMAAHYGVSQLPETGTKHQIRFSIMTAIQAGGAVLGDEGGLDGDGAAAAEGITQHGIAPDPGKIQDPCRQGLLDGGKVGVLPVAPLVQPRPGGIQVQLHPSACLSPWPAPERQAWGI